MTITPRIISIIMKCKLGQLEYSDSKVFFTERGEDLCGNDQEESAAPSKAAFR